MTRQELYNYFVRAKRPIDCFGSVKSQKELKSIYLDYVKQIHPDTAVGRDQYISTQGFLLLQELYNKGLEELEKGIYCIKNIVDLYTKQDALFEINVHNKQYKFYELIFNGELADIYRGTCDKDLVVLKLAVDENDNELLKQEYDTLLNYSHPSIPIVRDYIKINGCSAVVMDNIDGENLVEIMKRHPKGLDIKIVAWMMERLLSVVGYLHSNYIVHGNIIPENIIVNGVTHNVSLTGFSFHVNKANEDDKHYQIRNDDFSAPEVNKTSKVNPSSDIYSLGKLFIYMLGGNISNNGLPIYIDNEVRKFIRSLVKESPLNRSDDAWKLWDEWRELRVNKVAKPHYEVVNF